MASEESLDIIRAITMRAPQTKILAYAVADAPEQITACAEAGASGYLPRDATVEDLDTAVQAVLDNDFAYPPAIVAGLVRRLASLSRPSSATDALSQREAELATLIAEGLSNKEISRRLKIEVRTVKNHVHRILTKLRIQRRGEVAHVLEAFGSAEMRQVTLSRSR